MVRDIRKSKEYFETYITEQNKRIEKFSKVLEALREDTGKKYVQCRAYLANFYKDLISAKYSVGASKEEIKQIYNAYISALKVCKISSYAEYIDVLSLAILLDEKVEAVENILCEQKYDDGLANALKAYILRDNALDEGLIYPEYYGVFYEYLMEKKTTDMFLDYMEREWYAASSEFAWYESHKSNENVYVGYWCWLAGAVLKMKGVNVQGKKYIPVDLV